MRLPWLQIDQDGLKRARQLGRLLGCSANEGLGLALSLWEWALDVAPDIGEEKFDLSGDITASSPAKAIAAALDWPMNRADELLQALIDVGFIEPSSRRRGDVAATSKRHPRVKGLDRYGSTLEKRKRDRDRINAKRNGSSSRRGNVAATSQDVAASDRDRDQEVDLKEEGAALPTVAASPPAAPSSVGFFPWMRSERVRLHPELKEESPPPQVTLDRLDDALRQVGRDELERRYRTYLEVEYWATGKPPWHANGFAKNWDQCPPAPKQLQLEPGPAHPAEFLELLQHVREAGEPYLASHLATCKATVVDAELVLQVPDQFFATYLSDGLRALMPAARARFVTPEATH